MGPRCSWFACRLDRWFCCTARRRTARARGYARWPARRAHRLTSGIRQHSAHRYRAAIGINLRVNRLDLGLEDAPRHGIELQLHLLLALELALKTLRQFKVHIHRRQVFDVDQIGTVFDIVANVDAADTHRAIKRGDDTHAVQPGAGQRQLRLYHLHIGGALVHHALGDKALGYQLLVALEVGTRDRHLRVGLAHFGALQHVVQLHHHIALAHAGTIGKAQRHDAAGYLGAQDHVLARTHATHRLRVVLQTRDFYLGDFHADGATGATPAAVTTRATGSRCCGRSGGNFHGALRLVLVPIGRARRGRNTHNGDGGINYLGSHE